MKWCEMNLRAVDETLAHLYEVEAARPSQRAIGSEIATATSRARQRL